MDGRSVKAFEEMVTLKKPIVCQKCKAQMNYMGDGKYRCSMCSWEALDDFGRLKQFFDTHGSAPMSVIQKETGLRPEMIENFLKKGKIEIPEGSEYYLQCERCGCGIRYGRYCQKCIQELAGGIGKILRNENSKG